MSTKTPSNNSPFPQLPQPIAASGSKDRIDVYFDDSSSFIKSLTILNDPNNLIDSQPLSSINTSQH